MFYGKANDEKHYQKIAQTLMNISPKHKAQVVWAQQEVNLERHRVLEIRVFEDYEHLGYRFWVSPFHDDWKDSWVYHPATPKRDGEWPLVLSPDRIGEPGNWVYYGGPRPFMYANFAKTTAIFFFKPNGPLVP